MPTLDHNVKTLLEELTSLLRRKAECAGRGEPTFSLTLRINTLMGALRVLEAKQNG